MGLFRKILDKLKGDRVVPKEDAPESEVSPFAALLAEEVVEDQPQDSAVSFDPDSFQFQAERVPRTTVGLYYPAGGIFLIRHPEDNRAGLICQFGPQNAKLRPIAGDWNGDGLHGIGLYDAEIGAFHLRERQAGGPPDHQFLFGAVASGLIPLVGDWNGDGVQSVGLYDPARSAFLLTNDLNPGDAELAFHFGPANQGWLPIAGDWNGDGTQSVGLYDPENGLFLLRNRLDDGWDVDYQFNFGPKHSNMLPLAGDWEGTGACSVGLYDPESGSFHLRLTGEGETEKVFTFGPKNLEAWPFSVVWV